MKKILPYIFILLILIGTFSPFWITAPKKVQAQATKEPTITITADTFTSTTAKFVISFSNPDKNPAQYFITWHLEDITNESSFATNKPADSVLQVDAQNIAIDQMKVVTIGGLDPDTEYKLYVILGKTGNKVADNPIYSSENFTPSKVSTAQNNGTSNANSVKIHTGTTDDGLLPSCGVGIIGESTVFGCVIDIFYYAVWWPTNQIAFLAGTFFDYFIGYSLTSSSYQSTFVEHGWQVVRDVCNIFFILVLVYAAIRKILDIGHHDVQKTIGTVVLVALLINFSLFFTQVIIDSSNILARVFYDNIQAVNADGSAVTEAGTSSVSIALVSKFNPQSIIADTGITQHQLDSPDSSTPRITFFTVLLMSIMMNVLMIYVFCAVAFLFVGRIVSLIVLMIFSPLAFISLTLPGGESLGSFGWQEWLAQVGKSSYMAPVFIFFLYLICLFMGKGFLPVIDLVSYKVDDPTYQVIMNVIVPFAVLAGLLLKAKSVATSMSDDIGKGINNFAGKAAGVGVGLVAGGAAFGARNIIGRAATAGANNQGLLDKAASGDKFAKVKLQALRGLSGGSYDIRNNAAASAVSGVTGLNFDKGTGVLGLDVKKTAGGYVAQEGRKMAKDKAFSDSLGNDHHRIEHDQEEIDKKKDEIKEAEKMKRQFQIDLKSLDPKSKDPKILEERKNTQMALNRVQANIDAFNHGGKIKKYANYKNTDDTMGKNLLSETGDDTLGLEKMEKNFERTKTTRQKEYAGYKRRQSGKVFAADERDEKGNIKTFGKEYTKEYRDNTRADASAKIATAINTRNQITSDITAARARGASKEVMDELNRRLKETFDVQRKQTDIRNGLWDDAKIKSETTKQQLKNVVDEAKKNWGLNAGLTAATAGLFGATAATIFGVSTLLRKAALFNQETNAALADGHVGHPEGHVNYHPGSGGHGGGGGASHPKPKSGGGHGGGGHGGH